MHQSWADPCRWSPTSGLSVGCAKLGPKLSPMNSSQTPLVMQVMYEESHNLIPGYHITQKNRLSASTIVQLLSTVLELDWFPSQAEFQLTVVFRFTTIGNRSICLSFQDPDACTAPTSILFQIPRPSPYGACGQFHFVIPPKV